MRFFNSHLSAAEIVDAIDGGLAAEKQNDINSHLADCEHCHAEFAAFEKAIGLMRRDKSADAPYAALQFARNLYRTRRTFEPKSETAVQRILATLKLDVPFAPAVGERSANVSAERQMLFEAGDFDLDLRVRPEEKGFNLIGQILGEMSAQCSVQLSGESYNRKGNVSELGVFSFVSIPKGKYDMRVAIGKREIIVSELVID